MQRIASGTLAVETSVSSLDALSSRGGDRAELATVGELD